MPQSQFTILVGSKARGTERVYSDIDIVRVGHKRTISKKELGGMNTSGVPISYIDYDAETFMSLYNSGSLFIHHILTEGKLLAGSKARWESLKREFSVTKDLHLEINEQLRLCQWLARPGAFKQATMPLLSHLFRALKNAAIFSLAQNEIYIYDKREALERAFTFLTKKDIELLMAANDAYVRGAPLFTPVNSKKAAEIIPNLCRKVKAAAGRLLRNGNKVYS